MRSIDRQRGLTLVESMAALAIVGILAGIAVPTFRRSSGGAGATGFTVAIEAQVALARVRATATRRQQKLIFTRDAVDHVEASSTGLGDPSAWHDLHIVRAPRDVEIAAVAHSALIAPGVDTPTYGSGMGSALTFLPDGSASSGTLFVASIDRRERLRVVLYRTGASRVLREW